MSLVERFRRWLGIERRPYLPLWAIEVDGSYRFYLFARNGTDAMAMLGALQCGRRSARAWKRSMEQAWGVCEFDVIQIDDGIELRCFVDEPLPKKGSFGLKRLWPGHEYTMTVREWSMYFPEGGFLMEADW